MRQIFSQSAQGANALRITSDEPLHHGAAPHRYFVEGFDTASNRAVRSGGFVPRFRDLTIIFQTDDAAANDHQPDGITLDALLTIVSDHLAALLEGPSGTSHKAVALDYIDNARQMLSTDSAPRYLEQLQPFQAHSGHYPRAATGVL